MKIGLLNNSRSTHEDLQERAHNQDLQIQALLLQFDKLRAKHRIEEWKARAEILDLHEPATGSPFCPRVEQGILTGVVLETTNLDIEKPRWNARYKSAEYAVASYFSPGKATHIFDTTYL